MSNHDAPATPARPKSCADDAIEDRLSHEQRLTSEQRQAQARALDLAGRNMAALGARFRARSGT
jgi:hypothetical protein